MSAADDQISDARNRMLGSVPGSPALGRGPAPDGGFSRHEYDHPAAGWGAARSVGRVLETRGTPAEGVRALFVMNQEDGGFDCPGCAWPDDPAGLHLDICENGVKHVTWELTRKQVGGDFFAAHTVAELAGWSDFDLEDAGRLSEPMRYDAASDRYVPVSWEDAFELVGSTLRGLLDAAEKERVGLRAAIASSPKKSDRTSLRSATHATDWMCRGCNAKSAATNAHFQMLPVALLRTMKRRSVFSR